MIHLEYSPDSVLKDDVQLVWAMESESESDAFPRERILPDGIVELVFHYHDPFVTFLPDETSYLQPAGFAISQMKQSIEIASTGRIGFVAVRFYPWGAYHYFETPISTFLDSYVSIQMLWPEYHRELTDEIAAVKNPEARCKVVERFLRGRLRDRDRHDAIIDDAVKRCRTLRGRATVQEMCEWTQLSKKQLERRFKEAVGTTPKTFCRVSRFLDVCHHLRDFQDRSLSDLAYECGYFDQAHFIKDFKRFSGFTPKQFYDQRNIGFAEL